MLDRGYLRDHLDTVSGRLAVKGFELERDRFLELDGLERSTRVRSEELRAQRNVTSDEIGRLKKLGQDAAAQVARMKQVSEEIKELDSQLSDQELQVRSFLAEVPNLPHSSVPVGDESSNLVVREVGQPQQFDFEVRDHVQLGTELGILDPERAGKIAGARFTNYYGTGALLERALINFMLDIHTLRHRYREVLPPFLANSRSFFGTGNLPKFEQDLFRIAETDYYLVPTAEVPLTNIFADEIIPDERLPLCLVAYTPCFRSEAGSYGRDTRGLIRQHQFNKVELVKFVRPEESYNELEKLTADAEIILKELELPYRVTTLATEDLSFSSAKTYDLEVWIPSQNTYREISSCSNFEDFQARRAAIRYRDSGSGKTRLVHTLNGSGLAIGRTWVALVENFQQEDGSVAIPPPLRPYMQGMERIKVEEIW